MSAGLPSVLGLPVVLPLVFAGPARRVCRLVDVAVSHSQPRAPLNGQAKYTTACRGTFEIRLFEVPGWNSTSGKGAVWPSYTRVRWCVAFFDTLPSTQALKTTHTQEEEAA